MFCFVFLRGKNDCEPDLCITRVTVNLLEHNGKNREKKETKESPICSFTKQHICFLVPYIQLCCCWPYCSKKKDAVFSYIKVKICFFWSFPTFLHFFVFPVTSPSMSSSCRFHMLEKRNCKIMKLLGGGHNKKKLSQRWGNNAANGNIDCNSTHFLHLSIMEKR